MNKKLILNLVTLTTTALLLILVMFSWYVSNTEVRATGITGSTSSDDYTLFLERGTFLYDTDRNNNPAVNDNGGWYWKWERSEGMTFSEIEPGDAFFFRIVMNSSSHHEFDVSFGNIISSLTEGALEKYINPGLAEYSVTTDTTEVANKNYYTGTFIEQTVSSTDVVRPYTYYELISAGKYKLTTDVTFQAGKKYYKARFIKADIVDLKKNIYYEKGAVSQSPNAIGYKYDTDSYSYLYPLDSNNLVKVTNDKTLYNASGATVKLVDYLIEDTFKVHSIGEKESGTFYGETFTHNDCLYNYTYTEVDQDEATFDPNTTYYIEGNVYGYGDDDYMVSRDTAFDPNTTYYTRGTTPTARYQNAMLKSSSSSFETDSESDLTYYYFALEFNDAASLVTVDGVTSSNCYLYQMLQIRELKVFKKEQN